jgi:hypothetical protein
MPAGTPALIDLKQLKSPEIVDVDYAFDASLRVHD